MGSLEEYEPADEDEEGWHITHIITETLARPGKEPIEWCFHAYGADREAAIRTCAVHLRYILQAAIRRGEL